MTGLHETHSSVVVLLGDRAYKVKKPVDLGFLDFRTLAARQRDCARELELNRRIAPDVYLDVATLAASDGTTLEPVLVMRRMPEERRLSTLVEQGADVDDAVRDVARLVAAFHTRADRGPEIAEAGGRAALWRRWNANLDETQRFRDAVLPAATHERIRRLALRYVDGRGPLLAARATAGLTVDGHGDLTAQDIFCLPDGPRVLDCLEFDDRLRHVDVIDDVAFLAMEFEHLGRTDLAQRFLRWYTEFDAVTAVGSLQHHYIAYRAFVRAKVECLRAEQGVREAGAEAVRYAALALRHLEAGEVRLALVGGAPGSGKSTLAAALADRLDAMVISTDDVRTESSVEGGDRYRTEAKDATYREVLARTRRALENGESVIADATWGDTAWRRAAAEVASSTSSALIALHCTAPVDLAAQRADERQRSGAGTSEAGAAVAVALAVHRDPWPEAAVIDTSGPPEASLSAALDAVGAAGWFAAQERAG
ncbi:MAG TPA: AAA family ATPase [Jatrophihabitans sp.]|uniref:bifunctional aminoglycoside phosphotransferase/ATP-binding protein n=1 Tax=Jatrophihabitans sp. TaxID=1932789 RepID=UPI002DFA101C|nr:AAA family ATPase [Jatrophihabitans sp.]